MSNERNPHYNVSFEVEIDAKCQQNKKTTYADIKNYVKDTYGTFIHSTYISEVKRECGIEVHQPYNDKEDSKKHCKCPNEKKEQIKEAFRHFELI